MKNSRGRNRITCSRTSPTSTASSKRYSINAILLLAVFLLLSAQPLQAQSIPWRTTVWEEDFSTFDSSRYYTGTNSRHDTATGTFILTEAQQAQAGRLFLTRRLPIDVFDLSFRASFGVNSPTNGGGADGIVSIFAGVYDYPSNGGGALDFDGCLGWGVEWDTYLNPDRDDPSEQHVAVIRDESGNHVFSSGLPLNALEDDAWHDIRLRFRDGDLECWLDGTSRLQADIVTFWPFDGYFGFSSATGAAFNEHRIDDVQLSMPTRTAQNFGTFSVCDTVVFDTLITIRNNHPDNVTFAIVDLRLTANTYAAFSVPGDPLPLVLPPGGSASLPLRVRLTSPVQYSAVLELRGDNGEIVYDTLRIRGALPELHFDPYALIFPTTRSGGWEEASVALRNTGRLPVELEGLQFSGGPFQLLEPHTFPLHLEPSAEIRVHIRFAPTREGRFVDTLRIITNGCGYFADLPVSGACEDIRISMSFSPKTLLLLPGEEGTVDVRIHSLPVTLPVNTLSGVIAYDGSIAELVGDALPGAALPVGSVVTLPAVEQQFLSFRIEIPDTLRSTGTLFTLRFRGLTPGPPCSPLDMAPLHLNDDWTVSPPELSMDVGGICVNGSCRHPGGLYALGEPALQVAPHPADQASSITLTLPGEGEVTLCVRDVLGRKKAVVFEGYLPGGSHVFPFPAETLTGGVHFLDLQWRERQLVRSVLRR